MTTLLGYEATLTLDLDGEPFDISHLIAIDAETMGRGIHIPADALIRAVSIEREVRARVRVGA
jgi:hypothetical protein